MNEWIPAPHYSDLPATESTELVDQLTLAVIKYAAANNIYFCDSVYTGISKWGLDMADA